MMHLSTHNWMRAEPLETTLKRISRLGYESIEISGEPTQYDTKEVRALLKRYGLRCWGAVTLALGDAVAPDCGVCLDAFHLNIEDADMYASIRKVGTRLVDFHVADNNRMAAGQGSLDWPKIVATLKEAGYDGALSVEFVAPVD